MHNSPDLTRTRALLDWLDQQPIDMHEDLNAARRVLQNCERTVSLLCQAIARVELANSEGDPILSAWLPDAKQAAFGA